MMAPLVIFWSYNGVCDSDAYSVEIVFQFWILVSSWDSDTWYDPLSWCWTVATVPSQPHDQRVTFLYPYIHSVL